MANSIALYVHVPFCQKRCSYCSFVSYADRLSDAERYVQAVKKEIARRAESQQLKSVYFGGGTPSLLPVDCIESLMETIFGAFSKPDKIEVSLEANPGTVDAKYLKALLRAGINRLSIGLQSLDDRDLKTMGRLHNSSEGLKAVLSARSAGFDNVSLDLIYGVPGQTVSSWVQTLEGAVKLEPEHLSLYGLSLEPGIPMMESIKARELPSLDPDLSADQYELAENLLNGEGYRHYEISNWTKPGYECRHNLAYWKNEKYIGVGVGACSYLNGRRYSHTSSLDKYMADSFTGIVEIENEESIGPALAAAEAAILNLRLDEGIDINIYNQDYDTDILSVYNAQISELEGYGLIEVSDINIKLTPKGRLLGNEVFWRFLPEVSEQVGLYQ